MTPERLKEIDEDAIAGKLPDCFTVQVLVATIRIHERTIATQRIALASLRRQLDSEERDAFTRTLLDIATPDPRAP